MKIGDVIAGRYRLEGVLGRGGMSSVYWAHDAVLERDVAVKVLHEQLSGDPDHVERFRREARAIASLSHPNIVTVVDRGQLDGSEFIVFELVRGLNLKDFLGGRTDLPVAQALGLALQAARGLAFAHDRGVVHRDVKPQNVLVNDEGIAKVTDFGIARMSGADESLTQTGTILGTSDYLSPEQAVGRHVDERADQYSLGVLLYELLTGVPPYGAESPVAVALRHVHDPVPSVREVRPDVSLRVDALIQRAMAKNPDDRYRSMGALAVAIEACLAEEGGTPRWLAEHDTAALEPVSPAQERRERRRRKHHVPWRLLVILVALGAAAALVAALATGRLHFSNDTPAPALNVKLQAIGDYDPIAGDGEHADLVDFATDGDPATAWTTETYNSFDKAGVGILLDAGHKVPLGGIVVVSDDPGFTAEILAANKPNGNFRAVSEELTVEEQTVFDLDTGGRDFRYYVVWITSLDGNAHLNEVRAAG